MTYQTLVQNLGSVGKTTETWTSPDGTRVLVLPYGGRVLGLFPPGDDQNFFWTHTALSDPHAARRFYDSEVWHNSGGERTWLAPEVDFFFPDYPDLGRYWQQRALDPGAYDSCRQNGLLSWRTRSSLTLSRTKQTVDLEISKALAPALNPLRNEQSREWDGLAFAGFTLHSSLRIIGANRPPHVGLWHLTQLPHGGELLIPTFFRSEPKIYMGAVKDEELHVGDNLIRYRMQAVGEHKLGVRAVALTGRVGYLYRRDGRSTLVVKNFVVNPSGDYVDVPWREPDNFGYCLQACNVNSHLGAFSELEYHVPAIGETTGTDFSEDQSQLWAFRGEEAAIRSAARHLLSPVV